MLEHDFTPLFKLEHMLKDVRLCLDGGARPPACRSRPPRWPRELLQRGRRPRASATQDFAAVLEVVEGLAGDSRLSSRVGRSCSQRIPYLQGIWGSRRLCIVCDGPAAGVGREQRDRTAWFARGRSGTSLSLPTPPYANRFQGMGCHRARARRGRAARHPPQGRDPRAGQALRARARPLLPLPDLRPPAQRPRARVAPARAARARSRRACGPTASRPPHALTQRRRHPAARPRADPRLGRGRRRLDRSPTARAVDALSPFYVWTPDYAEKRLAWKRRHPLHVLLLRTYRIPRPVTVKVRDEYGGCRSWLELTRDLPVRGHAGALRRGVRARLRGDRGDRRVRRRARLRLTFRTSEPAAPLGRAALQRTTSCSTGGQRHVVDVTRAAEPGSARPRAGRRDQSAATVWVAGQTAPRRSSRATTSATRADAERVLAQLEYARDAARRALRRRVGRARRRPARLAAQLDAAQPWLPLQRRLTAPGGAPLPRRLGGRARAARARAAAARPARLERRGLAGDADARALGAARAPLRRRQPPGAAAAVRPAAASPAGCAGRGWSRARAQWLSGQTRHVRPAVARRLREGAPPSFPPGRADALLLGGTVFDLLAREEGESRRACARLRPAPRRRRPGARRRRSAGRGVRHTEAAWRSHLARLAERERPGTAARLASAGAARRSRCRRRRAGAARRRRSGPSRAARGTRC